MVSSREWFALQLRCAERVSAIADLPIADALLRFTAIYARLGLGYRFDPAHPRWVDYLRGLPQAADPATYTAVCCAAGEGAAVTRPFGCFRCTFVPEEGRIRLHFSGVDPQGALRRERQGVRLAELRALFSDVAARYPAARSVRGNSWLYGIEAYRRLYPPAYTVSAVAAPMLEEFAYMALWGQFIDHRGELKPSLAAPFAAAVERARTLADLAAAVPHPVYEVECAITHFYTFYGIAPPAELAR
jgi:hypothetical protein